MRWNWRLTRPQPSVGTAAALLFAGLVIGATQSGSPVHNPAAAASKKTGRLIVGVNPPVTPPEVLALGHELGAKIVNVAPDGAFVLICPRKGDSPSQLKRRSDRVTYVDPEVTMGVEQPGQKLLLVLPMRRLPGALVGPPEDLVGPRPGGAPARKKESRRRGPRH